MKKPSAVFAALAALLSLTACHGGKDDDNKNQAVIGSWTGQSKGAYIAGYELDAAAGKIKPTLWINGVAQKVDHPMPIAYFMSVFVSGDDVFTAVTEQSSDDSPYTASLVTNGNRRVLSENALPSSVFVQDGKAYVAGTLNPGTDDRMAVLWTDGVEERLSSNCSDAAGVSVSANDVYVAGTEEIDGILVATLWKNGEATRLGDGSIDSAAYSLFVSGADVYVSGVEDTPSGEGEPFAVLWKNGAKTILGASSYATSVHVSGNSDHKDVFVAGYEVHVVATTTSFRAVLWENGVKRVLPHMDRAAAQPMSVTAAGGDVYVAGLLLAWSRWGWLAAVWKNDEVKVLEPTNYSGSFSVFYKQ
jgi:hypothetical protein